VEESSNVLDEKEEMSANRMDASISLPLMGKVAPPPVVS
jgi:hypothetical protein